MITGFCAEIDKLAHFNCCRLWVFIVGADFLFCVNSLLFYSIAFMICSLLFLLYCVTEYVFVRLTNYLIADLFCLYGWNELLCMINL
jgi:hypothetical protein